MRPSWASPPRATRRPAAERAELGTSHAEIGAYLLSLWGLPDSVVAAVLNHDCPEPGPPGELPAALIVHAADRIAHEPELADPAAARYPVGTAALAAAGVLDHWSRWQAEAAQVLGGAEEAA